MKPNNRPYPACLNTLPLRANHQGLFIWGRLKLVKARLILRHGFERTSGYFSPPSATGYSRRRTSEVVSSTSFHTRHSGKGGQNSEVQFSLQNYQIVIYRYLLNKEPDQKDIVEALAEVEKKIAVTGSANEPYLVDLIDTWITLIFACHKVEKLQKIQRELEFARKR